MSFEGDKIAEHIRKTKEALDNERIDQLYIKDEDSQMKFGAKLNNGMEFLLSLDDKQKPIVFTKSEFAILKDIVTTRNDELIQCANGYKESGRDFEYFFYDVVALSWYVEKLPIAFSKLKKIEFASELMHDRIHAQLAYHYKKLGANIEIEIKHGNEKKPDLRIDGTELEVKSLISSVINTPESFLKYSKSFRNATSSAGEQIVTNGVIAIAPWSIVMNNVWKEYFRGLYSSTLPMPKPNGVIIVLDGGKVLEDYYLMFDSREIAIEQIRLFAESGYKRIDAMSYLRNIRRTGFAVGKSGSLSDMHNIGIGFTIG